MGLPDQQRTRGGVQTRPAPESNGALLYRVLVAASVLFAVVAGFAQAGSLLSETQARAKAIAILRGDPYGKTDRDLMDKIRETEFLRVGAVTPCGAATKPAWRFHIIATAPDRRIDGDLILEAQSGKLMCANLPLLD